jgi:hypothetical protein
MDILDVTGKELALEIGVDTTVISRIKSGERKLSLRSKYTAPIVTYLLSDELADRRLILEEHLRAAGFDIEGMSYDDAVLTLSRYITQDEVESARNMQIGPFLGNEGYGLCLSEFWKIPLKTAGPHKITVIDLGDIIWSEVEEQFIEESLDNIKASLARGDKITIVDLVSKDYRTYETLFRWMPIYLNEALDSRYITSSDAKVYNMSFHTVKGKVALTGFRGNNTSNITSLYTDKDVVDVYANVAKSYVDRSQTLMYRTSLKNPLEMIRLMEEYIRTEPLTYMINSIPSFLNTPEDLLIDILQSNGAGQETIDLCVDARQRRVHVRERCNYRQLYDMKTMFAAVKQARVREDELSRILGKDVYLTKEQFKKQLRYIKERGVKNNHYHLVLASFDDIHLSIRDSSSVVQDDAIAITWNAELYSTRIHCTELTFVGGFFSYLDSIWDGISPIRKDEAWMEKQLDLLLEQ